MMKQLLCAILIFGSISAHSQSTSAQPPRYAMYLSSDGGSTWDPSASASGVTPTTAPPPRFTPFCTADGTTWSQCSFSGGGGSGTVNAGSAFAPAYYPATGTTVSGAIPFNGIGLFSTTAAPSAAPSSAVSSLLNYAVGQDVFADSRGTATGATNPYTNGWVYLLRQPVGGTQVNASRAGNRILDSAWDVQSVHYPYIKAVSPSMVLDAATNDVTGSAASASQTDYNNTYKELFANAVYWGAVGGENKFIPAQSLTGFTTTGGAWALDTVTNLIDNPYVSSTINSTITYSFSTTATSTVPYVGIPMYNTGGGTATALQDTVAFNNPVTGSATFYGSGENNVNMATPNNASAGNGVLGIRFAPVGPGAHTIKFTITSATSATNKFGIAWVGLQVPNDTNPVVVADNASQQNNANNALTATFSGFISAIATQAVTDGGHVTVADVQTKFLNTNTTIALNVNSPGPSYTAVGWVSEAASCAATTCVSYLGSGVPFTKVGSAPAIGQYAVSGSGVYTLNPQDTNTPITIQEVVNCGTTISTSVCMSDTLHYNDVGHAVVEVINLAAFPAGAVTGNNVPNSGYPVRSYQSTRLSLPQMATMNGYNTNQFGATGPLFSPGGSCPYYLPGTNAIYCRIYSSLSGDTTIIPNLGATVQWAVANYPTFGLPTQESQLKNLLQMTGNGIFTINSTSNTINGNLAVTLTSSANPFIATNNANYGANLQAIIAKNTNANASSCFGLQNNTNTQNYSMCVAGTTESARSTPGNLFFYDETGAAKIAEYVKASGSWVFSNAIRASFLAQVIGTPIASASTIAPTNGIFHVTGTATISTITPPAPMSSTVGGCLTLIADAAWATLTGGNIAAVMTAVANTPYQACYDGSLWYIK